MQNSPRRLRGGAACRWRGWHAAPWPPTDGKEGGPCRRHHGRSIFNICPAVGFPGPVEKRADRVKVEPYPARQAAPTCSRPASVAQPITTAATVRTEPEHLDENPTRQGPAIRERAAATAGRPAHGRPGSTSGDETVTSWGGGGLFPSTPTEVDRMTPPPTHSPDK